MKIIGAIGRNSSGKDALLNYLEANYGIEVLSTGDVARELALKEGLEPTRENLHDISRRYTDRYGESFFAERVLQKFEAQSLEQTGVVGISGIRTPADVDAFRKQFGNDFILVHVEVGDARQRYERARKRRDTRDPQDFETFVEQDREEEELLRLDEAAAMADLTIRNDASLEEFHKRIEEELVKKRLHNELA